MGEWERCYKWKDWESDGIIDDSDGKSTKYVRVEISADTICGHPIPEKEFKKFIKCN